MPIVSTDRRELLRSARIDLSRSKGRVGLAFPDMKPESIAGIVDREIDKTIKWLDELIVIVESTEKGGVEDA